MQFYASDIPDSLSHHVQQKLFELVEKNQHNRRIEVPHCSLTKETVETLIARRGEEIDYIKGQDFDDMYEGLEKDRGHLEGRIDGDFALVND